MKAATRPRPIRQALTPERTESRPRVGSTVCSSTMETGASSGFSSTLTIWVASRKV